MAHNLIAFIKRIFIHSLGDNRSIQWLTARKILITFILGGL